MRAYTDLRVIYGRFTASACRALLIVATFTINPLFADLIYVTNGLGNDLSIIEVGDTIPIDTVPSGDFGPLFITFAPDGLFGYISNNNSNTVTAIDTLTNAIVATISVGNGPNGSDITPDGRFVYVANSNPGSTSVSVIDTATKTLRGTVTVALQPFDVGITPDGAHAYVTHTGPTTHVSVINTTTNMVETVIPIGVTQGAIEITPDGQFAYVTAPALDSVLAIDTSTNTIHATIPGIPANPREIAITPDGKFAYVPQAFAQNVTVIDILTNMVVKTVTVGNNPFGAAVTVDGQFVYVSNFSSNNVFVIETATNTVVGIITVGNGPIGLAALPFPQSVINLSGTQEKNDFAIVYEFFNELTWAANPFGTAPTMFNIYRNGVKVASINGSTFEYEDHNIKKSSTNTYSIVTVDAAGRESNPATITID